MSLPSLRFTVRRMMIAVAVVALAMGGERLTKRRAYYLMLAEDAADTVSDYDKGRVCLSDEYNKEGMYVKLRGHWHAMERKYRLAAARPWLPVEPDPPLPLPE